MATALATLRALPLEVLASHPTPIDRLRRLELALGSGAPAIFMKRDDLLSFGMGGNKVRKLQAVLAPARATGADTLITCGGVQSNHCRVTAAAGAALGLKVILVVNGEPQATPTGNARLDRLFGAEMHYVDSREARHPAMEAIDDQLRAAGRHPHVIPLGASTALGAAGFARGVEEVLAAGLQPDLIVHSTSSGGTQAGLIAGTTLFGMSCRVLGVSADDPAEALTSTIGTLLDGMSDLIGAAPSALGRTREIEVDDTEVGGGYGVPTSASTEAMEMVARTEGIVLDPVYTAKAMAGLIARVRAGQFSSTQRVLFWHTGGHAGFFA